MKPLSYFILFVLVLHSCQSPSDHTISQPDSLQSVETALIKNIERYPDSFLLKENLIQFYRENSLYSKAIAGIDTFLRQDPLHARCWHIKGILHFENNDTLEAIHAFENELRIAPNPTSMISLGTLYAQVKDKKSIGLANLLSRYDGKKYTKEASYILGTYYSATGAYPQAITHFDDCIQIDFTFMEAYREKAIALNHLEQFKQSIEVLKKAVTLQNNYAEGYYFMGLTYEKLADTASAIDCFKKALLYDPADDASSLELKKIQP